MDLIPTKIFLLQENNYTYQRHYTNTGEMLLKGVLERSFYQYGVLYLWRRADAQFRAFCKLGQDMFYANG